MRRLLQFGTWLLLLVMFLTPITECFDRWDAPGISNDTEFAIFSLVFALGLVLVVCVLLTARSLLQSLVLEDTVLQPTDEQLSLGRKVLVSIFIPPRLLPLRI